MDSINTWFGHSCLLLSISLCESWSEEKNGSVIGSFVVRIKDYHTGILLIMIHGFDEYECHNLDMSVEYCMKRPQTRL